MFSGLTAVPLVWLTGLLAEWTAPLGGDLAAWAAHVAEAVAVTAEIYPILLYGTDWPFYHQALTLARVLLATEDRPELRRAILHDNAARLLGLATEPVAR